MVDSWNYDYLIEQLLYFQKNSKCIVVNSFIFCMICCVAAGIQNLNVSASIPDILFCRKGLYLKASLLRLVSVLFTRSAFTVVVFERSRIHRIISFCFLFFVTFEFLCYVLLKQCLKFKNICLNCEITTWQIRNFEIRA